VKQLLQAPEAPSGQYGRLHSPTTWTNVCPARVRLARAPGRASRKPDRHRSRRLNGPERGFLTREAVPCRAAWAWSPWRQDFRRERPWPRTDADRCLRTSAWHAVCGERPTAVGLSGPMPVRGDVRPPRHRPVAVRPG
jgi:hypothetical protein